MFQAPSKRTVYAAPAEEIDVDQRYLFRLIKIVDEGVSKFADAAKGEDFHNLRWHFRVAFADSPTTPIYTSDGEPWEHVEWTTSKTGKNPKNGMVAKARAWMEALIGRALDDDEIRPDMDDQLIDHVASGLFENKENTNQMTGEVTTQLRILRLSPYKAKAPASKPREEAAAF